MSEIAASSPPIAAPRAPAPAALVGPEAGPPQLPGVSIVLPCFNEEENVADAVRAALLAGRRAAVDHEVIVVDDGSRDRTLEIALGLREQNPAVRVVNHQVNLGYGAALRSGIAAASQPWILLTDADLQFDLTQLEDFLPFAEDHDLIVGWRVQRMDPLGRRLAAALWNRLVDAVFGLPVRDVDCAFKLVRTELVKDMPLTASGAMISTELIVRCLAAGARLEQIGVRHRPRQAGKQSGTSPRVVARAFLELGSARRQLGTLRHAHPAR
jgi:cellulose synthase/poly-beta-1,6-N-acetylglucosamine synthase-like glycosyltransferase